ncbi:hypothetical protein TSUD_315760 [Trifolium subterraneum]|uniref:Uncharacterized protein n=1 Tax=Trifolium subterraneum TaxID=3900 RepID=A0A2Z6N2E9_TRISU|nr:hypothetical protein TSUD_315760 [Trifolium subterraneum]
MSSSSSSSISEHEWNKVELLAVEKLLILCDHNWWLMANIEQPTIKVEVDGGVLANTLMLKLV